LLNDADKPMAAQIASALAQIGDPRAVEPLLSRDGVPASSLLTLASRLGEQDHTAEAKLVYDHLEREAPDHLQAAVLAGRVALDPDAAPSLLTEALRSDNRRLNGQAAALLAHDVPE